MDSANAGDYYRKLKSIEQVIKAYLCWKHDSYMHMISYTQPYAQHYFIV